MFTILASASYLLLQSSPASGYYKVDQQLTFADANAKCHEVYGTALASIHSNDDFNRALSTCGKTSPCWLGGIHGDPNTLEISNDFSTNNWQWLDGSEWDYEYWGAFNNVPQGEGRTGEYYTCLWEVWHQENPSGVGDCGINVQLYPICQAPNEIPVQPAPLYWSEESTVDVGQWQLFEGPEKWNECPNGYIMAGFWKNGCQNIHCLEEMRCVRPSFPFNPLPQICIDVDILSYEDVSCPMGYFVRGIYQKNNDDWSCGLNCWTKLRCCEYTEYVSVSSETTNKDWWLCFDGDGSGWCVTDNNQFITGFKRGYSEEIYNLEEAITRQLYPIGYQELGCFVDTEDRAMTLGPHAPGYSIETCFEACKDYNYFSIQAGSWCLCENNYFHATKYGHGTGCTHFLGGSWRFNLFMNLRSEETNHRSAKTLSIGGKQISWIVQAPFIVGIINKKGSICTGTIIALSNQEGFGVILTAAHCDATEGSEVYIGCNNIKQCPIIDSPNGLILTEKYFVQYWIPHQKYERPNHDIALIILDKPISHERATEVKLATNEILQGISGALSFSIGYGVNVAILGISAGSGILRRAKVRPTSCLGLHTLNPFTEIKEVVCTAGDEGQVCFGDSGGPLLKTYVNKDTDKIENLQYGIHSYGIVPFETCFEKGWAASTFVPMYLEWILSEGRSEEGEEL